MNTGKKFQGDASRLRPASDGFECGETVEKDETGHESVTFFCTLPNDNHQRLVFTCREPSCGVLIGDEPVASKEEDGTVDPNFFDTGYTLAGRTGFQVWPGTRLLVEVLTWPLSSDCSRLKQWQCSLREDSLRVIELGSGVGVVGASLAAAGAQVLLTDLPTLVKNSLCPNLEQNQSIQDNTSVPEWLESSCELTTRIGNGWAGAAALDWTIPLERQLCVEEEIDLIIASDCVWLVSMLNALLSTVSGIFQRSPCAKLLMSFQRRDGEDSVMFTSVDRVLEEIKARQWTVECLAWRPVVYKDDTKQVYVFEIAQGELDT